MYSLLKGEKQNLTWWHWLITTLGSKNSWILRAQWPSRLTYLVNFMQESDPVSGERWMVPRNTIQGCPLTSRLRLLCAHVHLHMHTSIHKWINKQTNGSHYYKVTWESIRDTLL